jgi:antitoxin CptB
MTEKSAYMAPMLDDPTTKRLRWRAHHRGTREADRMIGGFFDAHHQQWDAQEKALFEALLEEQDVDIMAWAIGTQKVPERFEGEMMTAMQRLDYLPIDR